MTFSPDDYSWVEQVQTVDAIDYSVVEAINNNPGWHLIGVGTGSSGHTTLTYGWPWPENKILADLKMTCPHLPDDVSWINTLKILECAGCGEQWDSD